MKQIAVVGFDLSLRAPAACMIPPGWDCSFTKSGIKVAHLNEDKGANLQHEKIRAYRIAQIASWALDFIAKYDEEFETCVGYVEDYAFGSQSRSVTGLAELRGVVQNHMSECRDLPRRSFASRRDGLLIPVSSTAWRKMLLGKLPREGAKVVAQAAIYSAGAPHTWTGDECDAMGVANYGRTEHGMPALSLA
ncbi:MAG: hypothetical protein PVSMB8_09260 [Vulcanimicrobiaceae bacterium]